ncbi:unnamed protein product [Cuscuta campestris]|uniref:Uncharacterized protein n=1 Tax=Cuscuta campestris TaxID=132261 RepID=A0A484MP33_9ASTE|nr:unnamed protein product [Cuscuta campestris]
MQSCESPLLGISSLCSPILKFNPPRFFNSIHSPSTDSIKLKFGSHVNFRVSTKSALSSSSSSSSRGDYKRNTDQVIPPYNVMITGGSKGVFHFPFRFIPLSMFLIDGLEQ